MEYIQGLDGQISVFLHSLGIGFLLGVFYDAVCAIRAVLPGGRKVIFVTDILYVIVCAFASFCFILVLNDGSGVFSSCETLAENSRRSCSALQPNA